MVQQGLTKKYAKGVILISKYYKSINWKSIKIVKLFEVMNIRKESQGIIKLLKI